MRALSRRVLADGISAIAMVGLAGCATAPMHPTEIDPAFRRTEVQYATREPRGTIVVDPANHYLYYVEGGGKAVRYGVAVGGEGFGWSVWPRSTASRNGRTGIPPATFSYATLSSERV